MQNLEAEANKLAPGDGEMITMKDFLKFAVDTELLRERGTLKPKGDVPRSRVSKSFTAFLVNVNVWVFFRAANV